MSQCELQGSPWSFPLCVYSLLCSLAVNWWRYCMVGNIFYPWRIQLGASLLHPSCSSGSPNEFARSVFWTGDLAFEPGLWSGPGPDSTPYQHVTSVKLSLSSFRKCSEAPRVVVYSMWSIIVNYYYIKSISFPSMYGKKYSFSAKRYWVTLCASHSSMCRGSRRKAIVCFYGLIF